VLGVRMIGGEADGSVALAAVGSAGQVLVVPALAVQWTSKVLAGRTETSGFSSRGGGSAACGGGPL
jgi:hypothetical protein